MYFLRGFFVSFLVVFFADHILPGIEVTDQTKLPHIGSDLLFSLSLGLLNALIFPLLKIFKQESSGAKIALISLILNFLAYAILKLLPIGIHVVTVEGYILAAVVVTIGGFLTNFFEMKRSRGGSQHMDMNP